MKRFFLLFIPLVFLLSSCGKAAQNTPGSLPAAESEEENLSDPVSEVLSGRVFWADENGFMLCTDDSSTSNLFSVSSKQPVKPGQRVEVEYSYILTVYPSILKDVTRVEVTEEGSDLFNFYLAILNDYYQQSDALNSGISIISLDFSQLNNLTEAEKSALCWLFQNEHKEFTCLSMAFDELEEEGYITDLYFEDGIILSISTEQTDPEKNFTFSASKWRSGLGAIGMTDCKATLENGKWSYQPGVFYIS